MLHAQNGQIELEDTYMEYIRFGAGKRVLIMLPGLGDSLRSMKGTALPVALMYRMFAKAFTVYVFGRRQALPEGYTIKNMAKDQALAMEVLGIEKADVFGVSMGGMIAQQLVLDYPEKVNQLILAVTSARTNPILRESIAEWTDCAKREDHAAFMESNLCRIYSDDYCRKNRWMVPLLGKLTKPKSYGRFFVQAEACLNHDTYDRLPEIQKRTFVIGGEQDKALGGEPSYELARMIPNARLLMYPQWGHGLYEEAKDFNQKVLEFLQG